MADESRIIPDLFFPNEDEELENSCAEGEGGPEPGEEVKIKEPEDLSKEGFIPIHRLALEDLPEPIRTEDHLKYIRDISKNVVKVNNNGLSADRPDDDPFKKRKQRTLAGSGWIELEGGRDVTVTTNRHVLFNEEELHMSTFDVFFHYHFGDPEFQTEPCMERCRRTNGKYFGGKYSQHDLAQAVYKVTEAMRAHVQKHCLGEDDMRTRHASILSSHTFDLTSEAPILRLTVPIQLLDKDNCWQELHFEFPAKI